MSRWEFTRCLQPELHDNGEPTGIRLASPAKEIALRDILNTYEEKLGRCKAMLADTRNNVGPCTCSDAYKDRGLTAPDCCCCHSGVDDPGYTALLEELP